jgi:hypothetical protein
MPDRFGFRQIDHRDLEMILRDGEIRSKNNRSPQKCHQTSYAEIVGLRGTAQFTLPHGGVVNDYVAFYFSPVTAFTYTIHKGNVGVVSPQGVALGDSGSKDRLFLVVKVNDVIASGVAWSVSDYALNSHAPMPTVISDSNLLGQHVKWNLFDEKPFAATIPEIEYHGVCQYFHSTAESQRQLRKEARMAEFLVKDSLPIDLVCSIIAPTSQSCDRAIRVANRYKFNGLVLLKPGCFI